MSKLTTAELVDKKMLGLLLVAGFTLSGVSLFVLADGTSSENLETIEFANICQNGLCNEPLDNEEITFVAQGEVISPDAIKATNSEVFTGLELFKKTTSSQEPKLFANAATLFAEKDSFLREGIKNTNEGSSKILRVMGTEDTNNRSVISFNQDDVNSILGGNSLESATLKLFVVENDGNWKNGQLITIHSIHENWNEGTSSNVPISNIIGLQEGVTWSCSDNSHQCSNVWNGGIFDDEETDSVFINNHVKNGYWIKFDVTEDVLEYISGDSNNGWLIKKSDENSPGRINFASKDAETNNPELVLVFAN